MHLALRPYVTTGVAIVGASVIAVAPIAPLPADIQIPNPAVQLDRRCSLPPMSVEDTVNDLIFAAAEAGVSVTDLAVPLLTQLLGFRQRRNRCVSRSSSTGATWGFWAADQRARGGRELPPKTLSTLSAPATWRRSSTPSSVLRARSRTVGQRRVWAQPDAPRERSVGLANPDPTKFSDHPGGGVILVYRRCECVCFMSVVGV